MKHSEELQTAPQRNRDHMAKMRNAKAAKAAAKTAKEPPKPHIGDAIKVQLPPQYNYVHQSPPAVMTGVLDVQVNTDPNMQNVTLIVKGPAPKMRELVRFAIEQSVPFLNGDKSRH